MAAEHQKEKRDGSAGSSGAQSLGTFDYIKNLAESEPQARTLEELTFRLRRWWCHYYKRPYKDPLLDQYTLEELYYEYCDVNAANSKVGEDGKPEIAKDEWDWAAAEEKAEQENAERSTTGDNGSMDEGLSDDDWAAKYDAPPQINPTADEVSDGDIKASFGD